MNIPEGMEEVLEEYYTYKDILTLIKYIYGLVQTARCWFKEYTKTMTPKVGFKQCKTYPCILSYMWIKLWQIRDKPALMKTIECINKEYGA